jgi:hypothetical protein
MVLLPPSEEHGIVYDVDIYSKATARMVAGEVKEFPQIVAVADEGYRFHIKMRVHRKQRLEKRIEGVGWWAMSVLVHEDFAIVFGKFYWKALWRPVRGAT